MATARFQRAAKAKNKVLGSTGLDSTDLEQITNL